MEIIPDYLSVWKQLENCCVNESNAHFSLAKVARLPPLIYNFCFYNKLGVVKDLECALVLFIFLLCFNLSRFLELMVTLWSAVVVSIRSNSNDSRPN